jgi:hypothetical protein
MTLAHRHLPARRVLIGLLALCAAWFLIVITTTAALANSVQIFDAAQVLNAGQVRSEASSLPDPIRIYTVPDFIGSNKDFDQVAARQITSAHTLVIAINTHSHYLAVVGGKQVGLSSGQYNDAVNAFNTYSDTKDYTGATIAAIDSLKSALNGSSFWMIGLLGAVGVLLVIGAFILVRQRRQRSRPGFHARL